MEQQEEKCKVVLYLMIDYNIQRTISAACYSSRKRYFELVTFLDNEHYSNLQGLLIQQNPRESESQFFVKAVLPEIKSERQKILDKFQNIDLQIIEDKKLDGSINLALEFLLKRQLNLYVKELGDKRSVKALENLINILGLQRQQTNKKQMELGQLNLGQFMRLDKSVINSLQIFPKEMEKKTVINLSITSLFDLLNKCKTAIGTRCLKRWMKQPLQNQDKINQRLDFIQYFVENSSIKLLIQGELKKIPDLDALYYVYYKVAAGKKNKCQVTDLIKLYRLIKGLEDLTLQLTKKSSQNTHTNKIITELQANLKIIGKLSQMIQKNIIMDSKDTESYVRPSAQANLTAIIEQKKQVERQIQKEINQAQRELGYDIQKIPSNTHRFVMQVSKKAVDRIKEQGQYKFLTSKQTKVTFTTQAFVKLMNELVIIEEEYKKAQIEVLKKMFQIVSGYYPIMQQLSGFLSQLDVYTSIASIVTSSQRTWCRPKFGKKIIGRNIHHPLVKDCVANDCVLDSYKTIILTGPNMGGKSTYIRTVGICTYLAHIGCFVPADQFQTSIVDSIITRVGASDMQIKGISTFMSEMMESACMLKTSTQKSLVLIDQLGRGTSTSEGFGLAWAICQYLHLKINPYCLFATHFHEMTEMAEQIEGVKNMFTSCKVHEGHIELEFKIIDGKIQKSYGIEVARMLKFPPSVISEAQAYLRLYEGKQNRQQDLVKAENYPIEVKRKCLSLYRQMQMKISREPSELIQRQIKQEFKNKIQTLLNNY